LQGRPGFDKSVRSPAGSPMPMLKLVDVLAIESPERQRLSEVDDAIRDLSRAVEAAAERDGLDHRTVSRALVGVLTAAAARQAMKAYPSMSPAELGEAFATLAEEAVDWATRRALEPRLRDSEGVKRRRAPLRRNARRGDAS
jgi:hypothetical protein